MRFPEYINLLFFSFFILFAWLRPISTRRRITTTTLGVIGLTLTFVSIFAEQIFPGVASILRDWLPAPLMPMVYWQAGCFTRVPNERFQNLLHEIDEKWFRPLMIRLAPHRSYQWIATTLELAYLSCYVLVPFGLAAMYITKIERYATEYWTVVLAATYPCYALTAFVQTLPPRVLSNDTMRPTSGEIRTFNLWIVRHASIHFNTFPSAHVTATLAGSLVLLRYTPVVGLLFLVISLGIAMGAVTGRYHYAADVISATVLTLLVFVVVVIW